MAMPQHMFIAQLICHIAQFTRIAYDVTEFIFCTQIIDILPLLCAHHALREKRRFVAMKFGIHIVRPVGGSVALQ